MGPTKLGQDLVEPHDDFAAWRQRALDDAELARHLRVAERKPSEALTFGFFERDMWNDRNPKAMANACND